MGFDTNRMIRVYCVGLVLSAAIVLAYREHLNWDAHLTTKVLCEDMPLFSGNYQRCLDRYAPAGIEFTPL